MTHFEIQHRLLERVICEMFGTQTKDQLPHHKNLLELLELLFKTILLFLLFLIRKKL